MYVAAVFLPLLGAIIAGLFGRAIGDRASQLVTCGLMAVSAVFGCVIFYVVALQGLDKPLIIPVFEWISVGDLKVNWSLQFDTLSAVMVFVVTVVSCLIHIYSIGYMHHDPGIPRFFAYLSLFTFSMLMLVTADNIVQMFFGWEGVGVCSYLLIGFWHHRESANAASIKAFVVNRVGDFGFALGIFGLFAMFGSVEFVNLLADGAGAEALKKTYQIAGYSIAGQDALNIVCILLFVGAMGKSAQLLLHTWLPDAMEGPTPVSALIHAATMVTAGVFMVTRMSPLFEYAPIALAVVTVVGASTALFAATIGLVQTDIKRVIAYSTCSQLGYMFFAIGVSAYPAAIFHLMTHAFFKALLFLGAGSVIHGMSDEQDMRKMGGIWRKMKVTYTMMWIGSLALAGIGIPLTIIGFAGFFSKDTIIESAFAAHTGWGEYAFWLGIVAAFMTAFYSWRLLFMTFHGKTRASSDTFSHVHESPPIMLIPLMGLALGAIFAGALMVDLFVGDKFKEFWGGAIFILETNKALEHAHHVPMWVKFSAIAVGVGGITVAVFYYLLIPSLPALTARVFRPLYVFFLNKWYFDELFNFLFVRPAFMFGRFFWKKGDVATIDGLGPDGIAATALRSSRLVAALQTGFVYHYAFSIMIGAVALISLYLLGVMR